MNVVFVAIGLSFLPEDTGVSERLEDGENAVWELYATRSFSLLWKVEFM